jgi:hypothetical protein
VLRRSVENLGLGANSYFSHLIQWTAVFFIAPMYVKT